MRFIAEQQQKRCNNLLQRHDVRDYNRWVQLSLLQQAGRATSRTANGRHALAASSGWAGGQLGGERGLALHTSKDSSKRLLTWMR